MSRECRLLAVLQGLTQRQKAHVLATVTKPHGQPCSPNCLLNRFDRWASDGAS